MISVLKSARVDPAFVSRLHIKQQHTHTPFVIVSRNVDLVIV